MAIKLLNPSSKISINQKFREKRFKFFLSLLQKIDSKDPIKILDIGGTQIYWEKMDFTDKKNIHITLLNLEQEPVMYSNFTSLKGDACNLSMFVDNQFDIVYSNSVIEHLYSYEKQQKMANDVRRIGKNYYVQTPNYYFPIEPHWLFPFFQFLPFKLRVLLTSNFNLGHYKKSKTKEAAISRVEEVKLLTSKQMRQLFPDGEIYHEKFMGLTKSITIYRFAEA